MAPPTMFRCCSRPGHPACSPPSRTSRPGPIPSRLRSATSTTTVGLFNPKQDFTVAGSPVALEIGDFNGDARLDLVTVNNGTTNNVSVLLATGTPSLFAPKQDFTAGARSEEHTSE